MGNQALGSSSSVNDVAANANVDLAGKYAIVTGANTGPGIGFVTARALVQLGAHVTVACRDESKIEATVAAIKDRAGSQRGTVSGITLELSSSKSIKSFVKSYREKDIPLHVLVLNAGVMPSELSYTEDGFETQFGVNHLGHFLLANLLLDIIKKSGFGRIVSVTSSLHTWGAINWDDLKAEKGSYSPVSRYNQSKLANVMFTVELQRRLSEEGSDVTASCVHPGVIKTDLQRHSGVFVRAFFSSIGKLFMKNQEQGAATTLYAAIHPQANGVYFVDCAPAKPGNNALNGADSKRLWDISEDMVNLKAALMAAQGAGSKMSKKPPKLKAANSDEVEQI